MRFRVIALFLTLLSFYHLHSQDLSFVWEPFLHQWEEGVDDPELVDLNGFVTWRLYIQIDGDTGNEEDPEIFSSIVGEGEGCESDFIPLGIIFSPSDEMLALSEDTCCLFQHPSGSVLGESINEAFCEFSPSLCYDSWVSCGASNSIEATGSCQTIIDSGNANDPTDNGQDWVTNFEECLVQGIEINTCTGGGWFTIFDENNTSSQFDQNNQLLIGQFTVAIGCELNEGSMCVQYFIDGVQNNENIVCLEFDQPSACFNNPIFSSITNSTDSLTCTGDSTGEIEFFFEGGSQDLNAFLFDSDNNLIQGPISGTDPNGNAGSFTDLQAGTYYVLIEDNINFDVDGETPCTSITEEIIIYEAPELLSLSFEILEDVACAGLNQGEIQIVINGGLQPYSDITCSFNGFEVDQISVDTANFSMLDSSINGIDFTVTDALGCQAVLNVPQLGTDDLLIVDIDSVENVSCFGFNDGEINLSISSNGTPVVTWTSNTTLLDANAEDLDNLGPGWYHFTVDDGTSCEFVSDTIFISEPDLLVIQNATPSFINCFGDCNSTVDFLVQGGTGEIVAEFIQNSFLIPNGELCAGEAGLTVSDENGCVATQNVQIGQNDQILINEISTNVTCPDGCDGSICISPEGGSGMLVVEPNPLAILDSMTLCFPDLCADNYVLTTTDDLGCSVITNVTISQPDIFIVKYEIFNITCNGECDGSIIESENIQGGTAPYSVQIDNGINTIGNDSLIFENLCAGNYLLSLEDDAGCIYVESDSIVITEPEILAIEELTVTPAECGGENTATGVVLISGGTSPWFPFWNGNETVLNSDLTAVANDLFNGTNSFSLIDANNCTIDSIFEIIGPDSLEIVINSSNVTCTGMNDGTYSVNGSGGVPFVDNSGNEFYEIDMGGLPLSDLQVLEGIYPVTIEDAVGCMTLDTVIIQADSTSNITYTIFKTPVSCWNENDGTATVAAIGGYGPLSYQWSDAASQNTATAIGLAEDFYTVTITDTIGCTFTENLIIESTLGCFVIANAITPNGDGFNDFWTIGGIELYPEAIVEVFNRWGQQVFESRGIYSPWDGRYNNDRLPIADYYYVITLETDSDPITGSLTIKY